MTIIPMFSELIDKTVRQSLLMLDKGTSREEILKGLVDTAEQIAGNGSVSSILVLDEEGLLRNGSSPRLPKDYLAAIDGLKPHPNVGTCAAAAATGLMVITTDFYADDKWAELRHLPVALGFAGAWSMPIKDDNNKVVGTFGTYYRDLRKPSPEEINGIRSLSKVVVRVLAKQ